MPEDADKLLDHTRDAVNTIGEKANNAGMFDRTDMTDPLQQLEYKRGKIDKDYDSWQSAAVNKLYASAGLDSSYQEKMRQLSDAQSYYTAGETKGAENLSRQQEHNRLQQLRARIDSAAANEAKSDFERQRESIDQNYKEQLEAANQVANNRTFQSQGFKSQADANAYAQHLKDVAGAIHTAESDKLALARAGQLQSGQGRLDVLNQIAAGDSTGAARTDLQNQLDSEQLVIDPNDKERQRQFAQMRDKSPANFDASAARRSKLEAEQSDERILAMKEEAKDAQLRASGKSDEARISALNFSTEERIRSLQEQAAAEGDSTKKAQLLREVAAATDAGKTERDALQKELQRSNAQASVLSGPAHGSASATNMSNMALAGNLSDVSKRLDDAATKLEKAVSNLKTMVVLKD